MPRCIPEFVQQEGNEKPTTTFSQDSKQLASLSDLDGKRLKERWRSFYGAELFLASSSANPGFGGQTPTSGL